MSDGKVVSLWRARETNVPEKIKEIRMSLSRFFKESDEGCSH